MQIANNVAAAIENAESSLADFYSLINKLSKLRFVHFISKNDEADNIEWSFTYRGRKLTLQYSIFNGISLCSDNAKDLKLISKLASILHL